MLQGAALYNLFRQVGGSIGIAMLATMIDHRAVLHAARLAESVTVFSEQTLLRLAGIAAGLARAASTRRRRSSARFKCCGGIVAREASVMAFRDAFLVIFALFVMLAPLVPLIRRPSSIAAH